VPILCCSETTLELVAEGAGIEAEVVVVVVIGHTGSGRLCGGRGAMRLPSRQLASLASSR
jgi:hypothetical protein